MQCSCGKGVTSIVFYFVLKMIVLVTKHHPQLRSDGFCYLMKRIAMHFLSNQSGTRKKGVWGGASGMGRCCELFMFWKIHWVAFCVHKLKRSPPRTQTPKKSPRDKMRLSRAAGGDYYRNQTCCLHPLLLQGKLLVPPFRFAIWK